MRKLYLKSNYVTYITATRRAKRRRHGAESPTEQQARLVLRSRGFFAASALHFCRHFWPLFGPNFGHLFSRFCFFDSGIGLSLTYRPARLFEVRLHQGGHPPKDSLQHECQHPCHNPCFLNSALHLIRQPPWFMPGHQGSLYPL